MADRLSLTYLSMSGFLLTTEEGRRILIDPYLTRNPAAPFGPEQIPPVDLVVVTHGAFDHLGDALEIVRRDGCPLVSDPMVSRLAQTRGIPPEQTKGSVYGATVQKAGVTLRIMPAWHTNMLLDNEGRWMTGIPLGYLITTPGGLRIYHLGDTSLFSDLKLIGQLHRPHIGLIPVGAAGPEYGQDLPPVEAAQAAQWIGCELAIPIHFTDPRNPEDFSASVRLLSPWMEARPMKPGETLHMEVFRQGARTFFRVEEAS